MIFDVVVVDDEREIADLTEVYLQNENYSVHKFYNPKEALDYMRGSKTDLAVIDVMMPELDGFSLCREIRKEHQFPVIMLTAKVEDMDKINGLTLGADDYMTKPFNPLELVARVKAQLRRYTHYNDAPEKTAIEISGLLIDKDRHFCSLYGKELSLTPTEFNILWLLCENEGKAVSSEELFEKVWNEKYFDSNNTVMVHIRRIREKMKEPPKNPKFIKTVWGVGYKIEK